MQLLQRENQTLAKQMIVMQSQLSKGIAQSEGGGSQQHNSIDNISFNSGSRHGTGSLPVSMARKKSRKLSARFKEMYTANTVKTKQSIDSGSNFSSDGESIDQRINVNIPKLT